MAYGIRPTSWSIFAYAMNNYWHTNYRAAQGGDFRFRYIVTSGPSTDATALSRIGWEEVTPFEVDEIRSQDKALDLPRPLDGKQASFVSIDDPNLLLDTWKPAEDGDGTILRLIDLGGVSRTVSVKTSLLAIDKVFETDALERNQKLLATDGSSEFKVEIHPHELLHFACAVTHYCMRRSNNFDISVEVSSWRKTGLASNVIVTPEWVANRKLAS